MKRFQPIAGIQHAAYVMDHSISRNDVITCDLADTIDRALSHGRPDFQMAFSNLNRARDLHQIFLFDGRFLHEWMLDPRLPGKTFVVRIQPHRIPTTNRSFDS